MEFREGKSIPVVKEFQIEGSWGPVTPVKPTLPRSRPIYEEGQGGLLSQAIMRESQDFLSRFSQLNQTRTQTQTQAQAQAQTLLSCSISSMERNIQDTPNMNNYIWDRENVELQRQGLEEYLPHWSNQGRRTMPSYGLANPGPSSYPCLSSSWDLPLSWKNNGVRENASMLGCNSNDSLAQGLSLSWKNNGVRENAISMLERNSDDPLAQFDNMSFRDLLAMKGSAFEPSMISTRLGDSGDATINSLFPGNTLGSSSTFRNQEAIQDLNQQINGIFGQEMENSVFPHQKWNYSDVNSTPVKKHGDGKNTTLSPPTPDLLWRAESSAMSGNTNLRTPQKQNEHNGSEENEDAAAVIINLQDLNTTEVTEHATNSPGQISAALDENHNLDKGDLDLNKTPQKKTRRKRYLPKVVNENKPKRTPKPKTPKPTDSKDPPRARRKYVRKNKTNSPSTSSPDEATKTIDPKPTEPAVKSCKRSLKFDLNGQVTENNSLNKPNGDLHAETQPNDRHTAGNQFSSTVRLRQGEELVVQTSRVGIAYDLNYTINQELKNYMALPEQHNVASLHADQRILTKEREKVTRSLLEAGTEEALRTDLAQSPNSSPCASSNEGVQTRGSKRARSSITDTTNVDTEDAAVNHSKFWRPNHIFLNNADIREVPGIHFPEICKKRRTDKGQRSHTSSISYSAAASEELRQAANAQNHPRVDPTASKYYYCNSVPYGTNAVTNNQVEMLMRSAKNQVQLLNTWLDISRLKRKKRSKGTTRVRDLASLEGIASVSSMRPAIKGTRRRKTVNLNSPYLGNSSYVNESYSVYSSMEALAEEVHEGPQSKRRNRKGNSVVNSRCSKSKNRWGLVLYDGNQSIKNRRASSAKVRLVKTVSLEAITEGLELLNINRESSKVSRQGHNALVPYRVKNTQQNALVPYGNDGTLVPFEGLFDPIKRRRQRAKVYLDDETSRVWRLLLENIDNEGIDGTDEEKAKWWENERGVFRGRVSSFIARMRLVQGDRRFTPWKGSVLDSVIGVFLTQNVSDHLSSSAFMSLAARFPIKSDSCESTLSEEATSALVVEPEVCVIEPEESITWNEKSLDQPVRDWKSRVIYSLDQIEEKVVVNSKEIIGGISGSIRNESRANKADSHTEETEAASIQGDDRARDDATSSQQSVISSQNSTDSPNLQTGGVMSTVSESNSREQALTSNANCHYFDCSTSFMGLLKLAESPLLHDSYSQIFEQDQPEFFKLVATDSVDAPGILSSDYQLHQMSDFHINATTEQSLATEPTVQPFMKKKDFTPRSSPENVCSCYVLEGEQMIMQSQSRSRKESPDNVVSSAQQQSNSIWKSLNVPNSLQEAADVTESTTALNRVNNDHKGIEQIIKNQTGGSSEITNADSTIPKKGKAGKDKKNAYDWDNLRKQAQVNGCKKERPANTRDSIDWEAVRRADVSEISETIKERGMNNMLAERIKDLLDRLVKDHGSIDLEWLRDIPPDKAKEYLLSFRGLGLKSVECVRLLTLHHLAFPVDTNVGRIAVRLGWVPLQPLPEQLQLHLLELYPVLESIQKYLWPRLCKLDQKTLYELHYHMITFGKVFCTKRQPNCNACPLRGECRHFASAFASARLALPGPEERGIVASGRGSSMHVNPQININPLPLPPWSNHCTETNIRCDKGAPIVEVPSTPLSLLMPQPIHHLERKSQVNCEPIVEIPASPEPEPEQDQALCDIEDTFYEDPNEIPTIKLNMKEFTQTLQNFMEANRELQETGMSRALVALTPEIASIPTPKLKNISRLRTEHHVYELPDTHPLLKGMDKREPDDPCSYLLAIWTPGETADSIQPPERRCNFNDPSILCNEETCSYCSSQREANSQIVRGTLLIPCRTAMRGSFPLNGTYFQVNEVFADHDSSLNPIEVPRSWLWNLPRRTVYFGTSVPTIFRGLTTEEIQHCFWRGYVCVRGFDQTTRAPRPLMARLHFPASKMPRGGKGKSYDE